MIKVFLFVCFCCDQPTTLWKEEVKMEVVEVGAKRWLLPEAVCRSYCIGFT